VIGQLAAAHCSERRLIGRHFAARITPAEELALRAHLPDCGRCQKHYARHMLYAELVPGRPRMAERLGIGLGVAPAPRPPAPARQPSRRTWVLTAAAAATCVAVLATGRVVLPPEHEFGARGVASDGIGAALEIYRVAADGSTKPSDGWMAAGEELAFAYRNPTGFARLMVFGDDEQGGIYWFHPAWTDALTDPVAVPINAGVGPFELPEAIHHGIRGRRLRVVALFTNAALSVSALEKAWRSALRDPPGSARFETWLEVQP
jgi:hypothetical protein